MARILGLLPQSPVAPDGITVGDLVGRGRYPHHQVELLDLLTDLNRDSGKTIVIVLHDLNLACRYADHIIAMKSGAILAEGDPRDVITEVFGLACEVCPDPVSGTPMVVPRGRHHANASVLI